MTDEQLVREYLKQRNQKIFERIYDRYANRVYRKCFSYGESREKVEDLAQGAWIRIYLKLELFSHKSSFSTWAYRVTVNHCINELKKNKSIIVSLDKLQEKGFDVLQDSEEESIIQISDVTKILQGLSKEIKALLLLKYVEGYTYEEIASQTGLGVSAVKMKIHRAKYQLIQKK